MIRFWHVPARKIKASEDDIVSPADGRIIYIKKIKIGEVPVSIKNKRILKLNELTKTAALQQDCWLIGINMTLFDVHKNCAPVSGRVLLNQHFAGKFLSLKLPDALKENERNTIVIQNQKITVVVVQIASRLVKRIDTYVKVGEVIKKGDWFGMIRFGSQVDLIIPENCEIKVKEGEQVYAVKSIIAGLN